VKRRTRNGSFLLIGVLLCLSSLPALAAGSGGNAVGCNRDNGKAKAYGTRNRQYANVVVVAKRGGEFTDPVSAVKSIRGASAANPYLVKVMPGVYKVTTPIVLPSGVALEGSGEGVTEITSSSIPIQPLGKTIYCDGDCPDPYATLVLSDGSAVRDITVSNLNSQSGIAIFASGVVGLEHVSAIVKSQGEWIGAPRDYAGIYGRDAISKLTLNHVTAIAEVTPGNHSDVVAIGVMSGASLLVKDSSARARGGQFANAIVVALSSSGAGVIMNSIAEIDSTGEAISANATTSISGCRIIANNNANGISGQAAVLHSEIRAWGLFAVANGTHVASSLIQGGIGDDVSVVNCWDETFLPIANVP
jgi:hypothetical protein